MHPVCKAPEAIGQLAMVHRPVSQRGPVIVAVPEPAVVQHKELNAHLRGLFGDIHQLVLIEVEIGGFPVVQQNRTGRMGVPSANDVLPAQGVELGAHAVHTMGAVRQHRFRHMEGLTGGQRPAEVTVVQPHPQARAALLIHIRRGKEAARIHQRGKGRRLMAACAAQAGHALMPGIQPAANHIPFSGPIAGEGDQVVAVIRQLQAQAVRPFEHEERAALVGDDGAAGNHVAVVEDGVQQCDRHVQQLVPQGQAERPGIVAKGGRKAGDAILALGHLCGYKAQVAGCRAVLPANDQRALPHVAQPIGRILLKYAVHGAVLHGEGGVLRQAVTAQHGNPSPACQSRVGSICRPAACP